MQACYRSSKEKCFGNGARIEDFQSDNSASARFNEKLRAEASLRAAQCGAPARSANHSIVVKSLL
jgi:hypothetical protein